MEGTSLYIAICEARDRIKSFVRHTPLELSPALSEKAKSSKVYIKLESEQVTGSVKARGAFNKLCLFKENDPDATKKTVLAASSGNHESEQVTGSVKARGAFNKLCLFKENDPDATKKTVLAASSGNHGMAVVRALKAFGLTGFVYVRETTAASKLDSLRRHGAQIRLHGQDAVEAELKAREAAMMEGALYVSPYNDIEGVAGQGTIGLEILKDLPDVDAVLASVGGGGLVGGIAAAIKAVRPSCQIIASTPQMSKVMHESIRAGKIIFEKSYETLSDGTAGGIEENTVTFELCRDLIDEWILVSEEEIAQAIYFMMDQHHKIVEGAAGVSIGAFMFHPEKFEGKKVAIVSCGNNISVDELYKIIQKYKK